METKTGIHWLKILFHKPTPLSLSFEHVEFGHMDSFPQSLADHKLKVSNRRKLIPKKV
jgi:hypothetical protein